MAEEYSSHAEASGYKFCVHCNQYVADRTYRSHRALLVNNATQSHQSPTKDSGSLSEMQMEFDKQRVSVTVIVLRQHSWSVDVAINFNDKIMADEESEIVPMEADSMDSTPIIQEHEEEDSIFFESQSLNATGMLCLSLLLYIPVQAPFFSTDSESDTSVDEDQSHTEEDENQDLGGASLTGSSTSSVLAAVKWVVIFICICGNPSSRYPMVQFKPC
jgi:hypothetical protein